MLEASDQLTDYKNIAAEQEQSIADALNKTKEAGDAAKNARKKIEDVRDKLLALLEEIDSLGTVNMTRMDRIERQLVNETDTVRQLDREVLAVEKQTSIIQQKIKQYTVDLGKYRAEKKRLQEMYENLPKVCPRLTPITEN